MQLRHPHRHRSCRRRHQGRHMHCKAAGDQSAAMLCTSIPAQPAVPAGKGFASVCPAQPLPHELITNIRQSPIANLTAAHSGRLQYPLLLRLRGTVRDSSLLRRSCRFNHPRRTMWAVLAKRRYRRHFPSSSAYSLTKSTNLVSIFSPAAPSQYFLPCLRVVSRSLMPLEYNDDG